MSNNRSTKRPKPEIVDRVLDAFFVFSGDPLLDQLQRHQNQTLPWDRCTTAAFEGLQSIIHAAGLPFELTQHSVLQRQFDSLHTAERIEGLKEASPGAGLSPSQAASARSRAENRMSEFLYSSEGSDWLRDSVVFQLNSHLDTPKLRMASQELLVQAVIGSWTVFESFARAFIITWVNLDPTRASIIVNAKDLRDVFGKQVVSIETMDEHGFNLSNSMGTALFSGRRLDGLATTKKSLRRYSTHPNYSPRLAKIFIF